MRKHKEWHGIFDITVCGGMNSAMRRAAEAERSKARKTRKTTKHPFLSQPGKERARVHNPLKMSEIVQKTGFSVHSGLRKGFVAVFVKKVSFF